MIFVAIACLLLSAIPAFLFLANFKLFAVLPEFKLDNQSTTSEPPSISVLIPARDEANGIRASVDRVLASTDCHVEVIVLDDQSTDATAAIVHELARADSRVRCASGVPLPIGWNGKQYACYQLAQLARHDVLVFLDADVRVGPSALRMLEDYRSARQIDLLSAFPHQETGTWLEQWLIPLMHYLLLGYLPFSRMRSSCDPALAAGCGQLFLTTKQAYAQAGTHQAIASSRHDGIKLPRAYRAAGLTTDVVDGSRLAECRMYRSAGEVVRGVLKNANEAIAQPKLILVFTILLLGGSVMPLIVCMLAATTGHVAAALVAAIAVLLGHLPRAVAAQRLRQPIAGVIFHSVSVAVFIVLQWIALGMSFAGRQVAWRGRRDASHVA